MSKYRQVRSNKIKISTMCLFFCYNKYGDNMEIIEIITKKKNGENLSYDELKYVVDGYVDGAIKDYQMSSLLMAIVCNGMTEEETVNLTKIMIESGDVIDLNNIDGIVVDKHSTGGVGDKTTLILAPIVAACGLKVAKMSGRGLGHTGGTIDKLESIEGYQVELSKDEFMKQVNDIGVAVISQSGNLAPADKKIYALRDVTGTTESIPLIASSIMSKKIASGASVIVLDVKVGNGALMKTIEDARELSKRMITIGKSYGRKVVCILSNMEEPLGYAVGNGLEVKECIDCLNNKGPKDVMKLVLALATYMVSSGKNIDTEVAKQEVIDVVTSGKAYELFKEWIKYQHGNIENIKVSERAISIKSKESGFIESVDALKIGELAKKLGAGRMTKEDKIEHGVGIVLSKKVGDFVIENEEIAKVYIENKDIRVDEILSCFEIGEHAVTPKLILEIIK